MKKIYAALFMSGAFGLAAAPTQVPVYGWNTWKRDENVGKFERIQPNAQYAKGAMKLVPDADKNKTYAIEVYGDIAVKPDNFVKVTGKFTSSKDVSPGVTVLLMLQAKEPNGDWLRIFKTPISGNLTIIPGAEQQIDLEVDLKKFDSEKIGKLCPSFVVSNLKNGSVTILPVTVDITKSTYVPPAPPQGPGLAGFTIQKNAFKRFVWEGPVEGQKFQKLLDYAALGLNIVELTPKNPAVAWQWPDGDTIVAKLSGNEWIISYGRKPDKVAGKLSIQGKMLTAAAYGSGVIFRDGAGKEYLVEGGMEQTGMTLLRGNGSPELKVKQLYIGNEASSLCWIEEARRELVRAEKSYEANLESLKKLWGIYSSARKWEYSFTFYKQSLDAMEKEMLAKTDGFGKTLIADPVLRDRYGQLIWMGSREYSEEMGYFGGVFRKTWFTHLGGAGPVGEVLEFARKLDQAVAQARRVNGDNFAEGTTIGSELAAGWVNNLSHVFQTAGNNDKLAKAWKVEVAQGEAEDAQLVLTTAGNAVSGITVSVKSDNADAPKIQLYKTDYITVVSSPAPQLPLCYVGGSGVPDVLIPMAANEALAMAKYTNLPLQLRIRTPRNAKPGTYNYTVSVAAAGKSMTLPLSVKVHNFAFPERPLPNMGGIRPSTFNTWYKERADEARRNLALEMLDCMLEPLDLYAQTPIDADQVWSVQNGMHGWNFGSKLNVLADPQPGMLKFLQLLGSKDGQNFTAIPAKFSLVSRDAKDPLADVDIVAVPEKSVAEYRYLKLHYSETRGWSNRCNYSFFCTYNNKYLGGAMELVKADNSKETRFDLKFLQPDTNPVATGLAEFKEGGSLSFDSLRDDSNRASVLFDKGNAELKEIRLQNRLKQVHLEGMRKFYEQYEKLAAKQADMYIYGFDEVDEHLNTRVISGIKNTKAAFPKAKCISTAANPDANPEIFDLLDIHCPANAYAVPRFNKRMHDEHGIDYWTYVGGGGYYPFGNFERVDQPLVNSRAFMWEPIAFDHIKGFLYWDIHMWRNNNDKIGKPIDWSTWSDLHGDNNGMGALFYPGEDAKAYPSRRAHAMRDGIEDYAAFAMAKAKIAAKGNPADLVKRLAAIRENFSTGMSVFNHDADSVQANRLALYQLLDELK